MKNLNNTLKKVIEILSLSNTVDFENCMVKITDTQLITPIGDVSQILFNKTSSLKNELINLKFLNNLISALDKNNLIVRLNHIGFGYLVRSQQSERQRLTNLVKSTDKYLYEEESNDFGLWLFLGNAKEWEKPLIEFFPVEDSHKMVDYFLPHVQIDIDTTLDSREVEHQVKKIFNNSIKSYHIAIINGVVHIVRLRLGVMDGVNIFLDLATKPRNVPLHRQKALKKIS